MRTTRHHLIAIAASLVIAGGAGLPAAGAPESSAANDGYASGQSARVRFEEGGVRILRSALADPDAGGPNAPVFAGDTVVTDAGQRVELELASGTLLRIDAGSEVTFLSLPGPYVSSQDNTVFQLPAGRVRLDARVGEAEEFRIDTPAASIYLTGDADVRIEVFADGRTEIVTRRGAADVVADAGSVVVRAGMLTAVDPGGPPAPPAPFNTFTADEFDRWVARREALDRYEDTGEVYAALPEEVQPYHHELARNGAWYWEQDYGYIWTPTAVPVGWRPYHAGRWHHGPAGYFWVSAEPWGWAPYHYGRWVWVIGRGWCWVPGRAFGGAWVAWSWGPSYLGWAPLDYWNRPIFLGTLYYDYYDPRCWTFVDYPTLAVRRPRGNVYRETRTVLDVGRRELEDAVVVRRAPELSPEVLGTPEFREDALSRLREDTGARLAPPVRSSTADTPFTLTDAHLLGRMERVEPSAINLDNRTALPWSGRAAEGVPAPSGETSPDQRLWNPRELYQRLAEPPKTRKQPAVEHRQRQETERQAKPNPPAKPEEKPKNRESSRASAPARTSTVAEVRYAENKRSQSVYSAAAARSRTSAASEVRYAERDRSRSVYSAAASPATERAATAPQVLRMPETYRQRPAVAPMPQASRDPAPQVRQTPSNRVPSVQRPVRSPARATTPSVRQVPANRVPSVQRPAPSPARATAPSVRQVPANRVPSVQQPAAAPAPATAAPKVRQAPASRAAAAQRPAAPAAGATAAPGVRQAPTPRATATRQQASARKR